MVRVPRRPASTPNVPRAPLPLARSAPHATLCRATHGDRPAERALAVPTVRVETHAEGVYLVGPGWNRKLCVACCGRGTLILSEGPRECPYCHGKGFEPTKPDPKGDIRCFNVDGEQLSVRLIRVKPGCYRFQITLPQKHMPWEDE